VVASSATDGLKEGDFCPATTPTQLCQPKAGPSPRLGNTVPNCVCVACASWIPPVEGSGGVGLRACSSIENVGGLSWGSLLCLTLRDACPPTHRSRSSRVWPQWTADYGETFVKVADPKRPFPTYQPSPAARGAAGPMVVAGGLTASAVAPALCPHRPTCLTWQRAASATSLVCGACMPAPPPPHPKLFCLPRS
jgi:hypothetical protein